MKSYENVNMINCGGTNCYVIRCIGGDVLIDTGTKKYRDEIETWLLNYNIRLIVLTHGHIDHIENAKYFSDIYDAPIAMSRYDVPLIRNENYHKWYVTSIKGSFIKPMIKHNMKKQAEAFIPDYYLEDGMCLCDLGIEGVYMRSEIVCLDGHTRGSIGILDGTDLYCGDAVDNTLCMSRPVICQSPKAAKRSIERIAEIKPERLFFGHGMPVSSDESSYKHFIGSYGNTE